MIFGFFSMVGVQASEKKAIRRIRVVFISGNKLALVKKECL
jgi:hypothetical protein